MGRRSPWRTHSPWPYSVRRGRRTRARQCHACKQVMSGNHPDLIYVTHEKPASIGVDDMQANRSTIRFMVKPYSSAHKIYIVDEAEKMTVQAQNALLKTIEEPPVLRGDPASDHQSRRRFCPPSCPAACS